ncbi:oligosaccharide repeat unit polymerase [Collimonas sp. NPDC087041]|uniref:oligosaccharide repeat unit polymerase n=1 Tax=Collimonas sp. NPDC087041 TaxID=3363960 RepID=UPI00381E6D3C
MNFYLLATAGGGGALWLSDPREAYQYNKFGAGNYYLFWIWGISFLLLYILYTIRPTTKLEFLKISPLLMIILCSTYFTGSKQVLMVNLLLVIFYYVNYVKPIRLKYFVLLAAGLLAGFLSLQLIQGTTTDLGGAFAYFDYFQKTIEFVSKYDQIGPKYGEAFLSSFWGYIPRSFAPDKPLVYGQILIQEFLYPGAADAGYYPAFSPWSFLYLDFWIFGVAISGFFSGILSWVFYELFIKNKDDIFLFSLAVQATISLYMVPLHGELYLAAWFVLQRIILNFGLLRVK